MVAERLLEGKDRKKIWERGKNYEHLMPLSGKGKLHSKYK